MKPPTPATDSRVRVIAAILGIAVVIVVAAALLRHKSPATAESESPPPPTEKTVAETETGPPAPAYALRSKPRNFDKRRGAPRGRRVASASSVTNQPAPSVEEQWGIRVSALRLSMADSYIDMRYTVLDPQKASRLGDGKTTACLLDSASGTKLLMPRPPSEGAFPPTGNRLASGRLYFAVVPNKGGTLRSGSKVTLLVGNALATNLTVQ